MPSDDQIAAEISRVGPLDKPRNSSDTLPPITKVSAIAPDDRGPILDELAHYTGEARDRREAGLVGEYVRQKALEFRIQCGPGYDADRYQAAQWEVARDVHEANERTRKIVAELDEVAHIDPVTREETLRYPLGSEGRRQREFELDSLQHRLDALHGAEGKRRVAEGLKEAVEQRKAHLATLQEHAEAEALAEKIVRDERVQERAEALAKTKRNLL